MQYLKDNIIWVIGAVATAVLLYMFWMSPAHAADLGGNCCADLEERIAELEATSAKKGNRKVSLTVYGQVNKALFYFDLPGDDDDFSVAENSNAESFVGFAGGARFAPNWVAGYVLEVGVGGYDKPGYGAYGPMGGNTNDLYVRRSFVYLESQVGRLSLGNQSQATDGIAEKSVANTQVVSRMLTLRPLNGPEVGEALDIFDGTRGNLVRYDTPSFGGFVASTSWANGNLDDSNVWDVALHYAGEGGGFRLAGGLGYRSGLIVPSLTAGGGDDLKVYSGSASLMHIETGLFLNAAYGHLALTSLDPIKAWHAQGGIERRFNTLGKTTLFGEYADAEDIGIKMFGGGVVQTLDGAATDLYLSVKRFEVDSGGEEGGTEEATMFMLGARVQF